MNLAGIDGCKAGWILAKYVNNSFTLEFHSDFNELVKSNQNLHRILIDIPVGLSSKQHPRTIDAGLRKLLKNRHATVFNAPCRKAVYEENDQIARQHNLEIEKKSLSIQSLSIRRKIKEIDEYLLRANRNHEIIESHPEWCFSALQQSVIQSKKSSPEGIAERLKILATFEPLLINLYEKGVQTIKRKHAKKDDLLDAICLCLVNKLGAEKELSFLQTNHTKDQHGIYMKIAYFNPLTHLLDQ